MREIASYKSPKLSTSPRPITGKSIGEMLIGPPLPRSSHAEVTTFGAQFYLDQIGQCEHHGPFAMYAPSEIPGYPPRRVNFTCPACKRQSQFLSVMADVGVPRRYQTATLDSWPIEVGTAWEADQRDALAVCRDFASSFTQRLDSGYGLLLLGDPGTGKTHLSYAVERSVREQRYTVGRITAQQYLDKLWALDFKEREGWITNLAKVDLLIFEELGRSSDTKGAQDAFFRLFDARWLEQRPNLFTSNLTLDAVKAVLGLATYDRAVKGSTAVTMSWASFRGRS